MCDPFTLMSIAAMAAGTGANAIGQSQVNNAREDAVAAERIRQQRLDQEAQVLNDKSRDRYNNVQVDQAAKASELSSMYDQVQQSVVSPGAAPVAAPAAGAGGSSVVAREAEKQAGLTNAFNTQQALAQGKVSSFGEMLGDKLRLQGRDAAQVGQIGKFKQAWAGLLPLALEDANQQGAGMRMFGDLLRGVGSLGMGAMAKAPLGAQSIELGWGDALRGLAGGAKSAAPVAPLASAAPNLFSLY